MQKLSEIIRLRVSPQTYKKLVVAATEARRTLSDYARLTLEAALHKEKK